MFPVYLGRDSNTFRMLRSTTQGWTILDSRGRTWYSAPRSPALHPTTVAPDEWDANHELPQAPSPVFEHVGLEEASSPQTPLSLHGLGLDFFVRGSPAARPSILWYIDPHTGQVHHTGTKCKGGRHGKRYCALCGKSISSNNFVGQHMSTHPSEWVTTLDDVRRCLREA